MTPDEALQKDLYPIIALAEDWEVMRITATTTKTLVIVVVHPTEKAQQVTIEEYIE
jgi:hypothetical protein